MHKFTYQFLKDEIIKTDLFSLANIITDLKFKADDKKIQNKELFLKLETIAIKESIVGSNAIEGIVTTANRFNDIVENKSNPITHSEEEILGYRDALKFIKENYEYLSFDEKTIKALHLMLYSHHSDYEKGGQYKNEDNIIAEKYPDGRIKRIIFTPTKAKDTPKAMKDLILAYQVARDDYEIPSLLLIPCVIVDFLSIHPFKDGNGRLSRLLTLLLLFKSGFDITKYISFENKINVFKSNYYHALEMSQFDWHDSKNTYYPFVQFTFQILYECYKDINKRFIETKTGKNKKKDRIETVVLDSIVPISKAEIQYLVPDASITTIEAILGKMVKENKIIKIGTFKNAKYLKRKDI